MNPSGSQDVEMQNSSQPNIVSSVLSQSAHPGVCVAHFGFKILCLIVYLLGSLFGYVMTFILVTLMLAFDFWVVKNISGRLLVQLRWWNDIKEDGSSEWYKLVFESSGAEVNGMDKKVFWAGLMIWPAIWLVFFVKNLLTFNFDNLILVTMALSFGGSNVPFISIFVNGIVF